MIALHIFVVCLRTRFRNVLLMNLGGYDSERNSRNRALTDSRRSSSVDEAVCVACSIVDRTELLVLSVAGPNSQVVWEPWEHLCTPNSHAVSNVLVMQ